ncbi:MAG: DUF4132 domain-containing protein, partial [Bacteroidota bacterium]
LEETLAWRDRLFDWKIKQPFKQAFREIYLLTPAEEATYDHSNRFAGHHLDGGTLYSLGKTREWKMDYQEPPIFESPDKNWQAILNINGGVLFSNCTTLELQFVKLPNKETAYVPISDRRVPLHEVPPILLSEVMRDIDLFVAVAGLGIDPFYDQLESEGQRQYWREVSFGDRSKTPQSKIRKDLLKRLLPMTKLAKRYSFAGNFLKIEGKRHSYKINLGSGNVLMSPSDRYLCIVMKSPARKAKQIWLPFEGGDHVLSLILSKAFLLAADDQITDQSILIQLDRN